jgi:hypothetical protein
VVLHLINIPIDNLPETYLEDLFGHDALLDQFADEFAHAGYFFLVFVLVEVGGGGRDLL